MDTYDYACYLFARQMIHDHFTQHSAGYHRLHQPWHSMEFIETNAPHLMHSEAKLAGVLTPDQFSGPPSGVIAICLSVLRANGPARSERLIPAGEPTPFVTGLEREVGGPNPYLVQELHYKEDTGTGASQITWPEVAWWKSWKTPSGHRWSFGRVTPSPQEMPPKAQVVPLNWNSEAFIYAQP